MVSGHGPGGYSGRVRRNRKIPEINAAIVGFTTAVDDRYQLVPSWRRRTGSDEKFGNETDLAADDCRRCNARATVSARDGIDENITKYGGNNTLE